MDSETTVTEKCLGEEINQTKSNNRSLAEFKSLTLYHKLLAERNKSQGPRVRKFDLK